MKYISLWIYVFCCLLGCGSRPPVKHTVPKVFIGTNPSQSTLLRSAWYKVLTEDYQTARKHFQQAGDHPWSRLGLGYLARLRLDHTRTKSLLEPLRNRSDDVGELARWWSQSTLSSIWTPVLVQTHKQTRELAPNLALRRHGFNLIEAREWTTVSVGHAARQGAAHHIQHARFQLSRDSACIRIDGPEAMLILIDGETTRKPSTRNLFIEPDDVFSPIEMLWTGDTPPKLHESPKSCEAFTTRMPQFVVPKEDGVLWAFIQRETALMHNDHMQILGTKLNTSTQSSAPFILQTLMSLQSVGASWHEKRMKLQSLIATTPAPLLSLHLAIQAYQLKNFEDAWASLRHLIKQHDDDRESLYWSIKTLLALERDNETPLLAKRYLSLGPPDCKHLDVVLGPLGESSANINQLIDTDLACQRFENAVERTLRWYRLDRAEEMLSTLGQTAHAERLKSRLLIALNRTSEAAKFLLKHDRVKYDDLGAAETIKGLVTHLLPKIVRENPNSYTAMQLNAWLPGGSRLKQHGKTTLAQDHMNTRVLSQEKVIEIDESGHGHLIHKERLRINNVLAARNYAEIGVPEDALFPFVEVEKPNGVTHRPLDIAEKGTFSLPNLDVGDIITVQYILPISNDGQSEHIGPPKLRLELPYAPVDYSSFIFIYPDRLKWTLTRTEPSALVTETISNGSRISTWSNEDLPKLWRERHSADLQFRGNFIRLHDPDVVHSFLKQQTEIFLLHRIKRYPWVSPTCTPSRFDRATQSALTQQINTWLNAPFTTQLTALEFSGIISHCLDKMGVPHSVALLSPWASKPLPAPLKIEAHTHPIFLVNGDQFWDPIGYQLPPGLVPHPLRNTSGYLIFPFSRLGSDYESPSPTLADDLRDITVSMNTHPDGYLIGRVTEEINGVSAYLLRQQLLQTSTNEFRQFIRQQLGRLSPIARLDEVDIRRLEETRVSITYTFALPQAQTVELSAFAQRLNSTFTNDFKRTADLFIDEPITQRVRLIIPDSVGRVDQLPVERVYTNNRFVIDIPKSDHQEFIFTLQVPRQRITLPNFSAFQQWCADIEALESIKIKTSMKSP